MSEFWNDRMSEFFAMFSFVFFQNSLIRAFTHSSVQLFKEPTRKFKSVSKSNKYVFFTIYLSVVYNEIATNRQAENILHCINRLKITCTHEDQARTYGHRRRRQKGARRNATDGC